MKKRILSILLMSAILLTLTPISQTKSASIDEVHQMQDVNIQRREEIERERRQIGRASCRERV